MTTMTFDTLAYAKKLQQVGFTQQQAEIQVEALKEVVHDHLATKHDLDDMRKATKHDLEDLKKDITLRLGAIVASAMGILSILVTVLSRIH